MSDSSTLECGLKMEVLKVGFWLVWFYIANLFLCLLYGLLPYSLFHGMLASFCNYPIHTTFGWEWEQECRPAIYKALMTLVKNYTKQMAPHSLNNKNCAEKNQFVQHYLFLPSLLFLFLYLRRIVGIWESCFQCFWVSLWTYRNTKKQENCQEVFRWTHLFPGVVHANHRRAGGFCFSFLHPAYYL